MSEPRVYNKYALELADDLRLYAAASPHGFPTETVRMIEQAEKVIRDLVGSPSSNEPVAMLGGIHGVTLIRHIEAMRPEARSKYHTPLYRHPEPSPAAGTDDTWPQWATEIWAKLQEYGCEADDDGSVDLPEQFNHWVEDYSIECQARAEKAVNAHDRLVEALEFIRDGYDNHDVNHVDYRVKVYQVALDVLAAVSRPQDKADG